MNKKTLMIVTCVVVAVGAAIFFYRNATKDMPQSHVTDSGAEIEVPEGAVGFACDCGCQDSPDANGCNCDGCPMHEEEESEPEPEIIYFSNPEEDENALFIRTEDLEVKPLTEDDVEGLVNLISVCRKFSVRRCESTIIDNRVDDPQFRPIAEAKYLFDAETKRVYNVKGEDITEVISFSVKGCDNGYDFLKAYFSYKGVPYDFMTTDTSHKRSLVMNQRVYGFEEPYCDEIVRMQEDLGKEVGAYTLDKTDATFQINTDENGNDFILYVTLTVAGKDEAGATVIKYVTYTFDYDGVLED